MPRRLGPSCADRESAALGGHRRGLVPTARHARRQETPHEPGVLHEQRLRRRPGRPLLDRRQRFRADRRAARAARRWPRNWARASRRAPPATTARRASRSRTTTTCARPGCSGSACRRPTAASAPTSSPTRWSRRRSASYCGATALTFNMHVCSSLWPGVLADALDMTPAQRAEHEGTARCTSSASSRTAPSTPSRSPRARPRPPARRRSARTATKVDGGWLLNGKKIFASLSGAADYYGVLCTEDEAGGERHDARHAVHRGARPMRPACRSSATGIRWACAAPSRARCC